MLDLWIIEQIEKDKQEVEQPCLELPLDNMDDIYQETVESDIKEERGVFTIDLQ